MKRDRIIGAILLVVALSAISGLAVFTLFMVIALATIGI